MAGAQIAISVDDAEIAAGLQALSDAGADLAEPMAEIAAAMLFGTQRRFETKRGPDGLAWAPFAPTTLERMPARRKPPELLRDSGRLFQSQVAESSPFEAIVGTNLAYAGIHQFGGTIPVPEREASATFVTVAQGAFTKKDGTRVGSRLRFARANTRAKSREVKSFRIPAHSVTIPARPYLGVSADDKAEILAILGDHLTRAKGVEGEARP